MPDVVLKDQYGIKNTYSNIDTVSLNTTDGTPVTYVSEHLIQNQVQSDWNQTDRTKPDYIKNKPDTFESEPELPAITSPDDNGMLLGIVDGKWDKVAITKCPTGTIEENIVIEWHPDVVPTVTFDIAELGVTAYKISDNTPTKEQLLSANWSIYDGSEVVDLTISETNITETNVGLIVELLSSANGFAYIVCYGIGELGFSFSGIEGICSVPETGIYQVLNPSAADLLTMLYGSITYKIISEVNFVQPNWNQNDYTQPDYIKNRPFYEGDKVMTELFPESKVPFTYSSDENAYVFVMQMTPEIVDKWNSNDWSEMIVGWNETTYTSQAQFFEGIKVIGNIPYLLGAGDNEEPFIMMMASKEQFGQDICIIYLLDEGIPDDPSTAETKFRTMSFNYNVQNIVKIPQQFLYKPDWNEINQSSGSYIKNKPFCTYPSGAVLFDGTLAYYGGDGSEYIYMGTPNIPITPKADCTLAFVVGSTKYRQHPLNIVDDGAVFEFVHNNIDYFVLINNSMVVVFTTSQTAPKMQITLDQDIDITIPKKYLPKEFGLPEVAIDDAGKFLRVGTNGQWVVEPVPSAEGASF